MKGKYEALVWISIAMMLLGLAYAYGFTPRNEMLYGDKWDCGYIVNMTNLSQIRDCYRD